MCVACELSLLFLHRCLATSKGGPKSSRPRPRASNDLLFKLNTAVRVPVGELSQRGVPLGPRAIKQEREREFVALHHSPGESKKERTNVRVGLESGGPDRPPRPGETEREGEREREEGKNLQIAGIF